MKSFIKSIAFLALAILNLSSVYGQVSLSGVINRYAKVTAINSGNNILTVDDASGFSDGDTVLVMQMKGIDVLVPNITIQNVGNTGVYELTIVGHVDNSVNTISLNSPLQRSYKVSEPVQVIRIRSVNTARISSTLSCDSWNGSTGGVLALIVNDSLVMDANIDVSEKGFRGGVPNAVYPYDCLPDSHTPSSYYDYTYLPDSARIAGYRGEGVIADSITALMPKGCEVGVNGGGGGIGKFFGSGGGGNYGLGGIGGVESSTCTLNSVFEMGGDGGGIPSYYYTNTGSFKNRVFMGGGGGSGTQASLGQAASGGNGGGIVILLADKLISNGYKIRANGANVTTVSSVSGAGGGGGGIMLLDFKNFSGSLQVEAYGGVGGSTSGTICTGAGGGGGGGVAWFSMNNIPSGITKNLLGGQGGSSSCATQAEFFGGDGDTGRIIESLILPLTGFLFNTIKSEQLICEADSAEKLIGSNPKGGDGYYTYQWQSRFKTTSWGAASGTNNERDYNPGQLYDTTWFRRIVISSGTADTSLAIIINVIPAITNNLIASNQPLCAGNTPNKLIGAHPNGGDKSYSFQWESSNNLLTWSEITSGNDTSYSPGALTDSTYFRRKVTSVICTVISDTVLIDVYPVIVNNDVSKSHFVCSGNQAKTLSTPLLDGGNDIYYYLWQRSYKGSTWANVSTNASYSPGIATDTSSYHRIVYSGRDSSCVDTSNTVVVSVIPPVNNNLISGTDTICENNSPIVTSGEQPGGADLANYYYLWIVSTDSSNYTAGPQENTNQDYAVGPLVDTTYIRRIVYGSIDSACVDTSTVVKIVVQPSIKDNILFNSDTTICYGAKPFNLEGRQPYDGDNVHYYYTWQSSYDELNWVNAKGTNNQIKYNTDTLYSTRYFRRIVTSDRCIDSLAVNAIKVLPLITGNTIPSTEMTCYNTAPATLIGSSPGGGTDTSFTYLWQSSLNGSSWDTANGTFNEKDYSPDALMVATYYRRIIYSGPQNCCSNTSTQGAVGIYALPIATFEHLVDTICNGDGRTLNISLTIGTPPYSLVYTQGADDISVNSISTSLYSFDVSPPQPTLYKVKSLKDSHQCEATSMTDSAFLYVYLVPQPFAGDDADTCGPQYRLKAEESIYSGVWTAENGIAFNDSTLVNTVVNVGNNYGSHKLIWTEVNGICKNSDSVEIMFYEQPAKPFAGNDSVLDYQFYVDLYAEAPLVGSGVWTLLDGEGQIADPTSNNTRVEGLTKSQSSFVWTVTNGTCPSVSDTVNLIVKEITPPTGFSPNGDGINDYFQIISNLSNISTSELVVINRWGNEVLRKTNYQNDWDGTDMNGNELPDDTYFYILYIDNKLTYKGYIVLKRSK